ncbi:sensor histidine kinase [Planctobacterium marinum]|uniref:histidine kinase n=1 Tax=Planctobacterium marinum TaxID=1631968 RepID=A0AA48KRK0_9ALTE|nr:histidine kinase [Planctobacterium marinum]
MIFKRYSSQLFLRVLLLATSLYAFAHLLLLQGFIVTQWVLGGLILLQFWGMQQQITRTNLQIARFLQALRYRDFSARFDFEGYGDGFEELGREITETIQQEQQRRELQEQTTQRLKSVIEQVPVPLLSIHSDGRLTLWNNAVRRLFNSSSLTRIEDLERFGSEFLQVMQSISGPQRRLVKFVADGIEHQLSISVREVIHSGNRDRVISLQDIASELEKTQIDAWQDLVKVLTHEIINSITPISSLASTADSILAELPKDMSGDDLDDARQAISTVAKRCEGLQSFVNSYRSITHLPAPVKKPVKIVPLLTRVQSLFAQQWQEQHILFNLEASDPELEVSADPQMLEQLFINLFQNAEQAKPGQETPLNLTVRVALNKRSKLVISVCDDGSGIAPEIKDKIFVPFFTTKKSGSGVGLALARQIMLVHGGNIRLEEPRGQGAEFTLIFP